MRRGFRTPARSTSCGVIIVAATGIGTVMGYLEVDPIKALVWSAIVNGVISVPIMAAMMMVADWSALGDDLPPDLVKAGVVFSGLYDLEPVQHAAFVNDDLRLALVPSFVLQPLVENAIKYAVAPSRAAVTIRVEHESEICLELSRILIGF